MRGRGIAGEDCERFPEGTKKLGEEEIARVENLAEHIEEYYDVQRLYQLYRMMG